MNKTTTRHKAGPTVDTVFPAEPAPPGSLLRGLGIVGYDHLEPVIVAALAEEAPLLLIGAHGTAKSLLLNRLAEALGLVHRHYNASLLNFDDLVGFPYPSSDRKSLDYIQTPATVWEAESVFLDEISRCRPDLQNKLFPVIHERVVQGLPLPKLRHRWAAMNPPAGDDDDGALSYQGSEPLDPALADRFAFVVGVPGFDDLSEADQIAVLSGAGERVADDAAQRLCRAVASTRTLLPNTAGYLTAPAAEYVRVLAGKLDAMQRPVSPRRGRQMVRNIVAVHAARLALGETAPKPQDSAFGALRASLPHPAHGQAIDEVHLLVAHRAAWELVKLPGDDPTRLILTEADPLKRLSIAISLQVEPLYLSSIILDTVSGLPEWQQRALATYLFLILSESTDLTAAAFDMLADRAGPAMKFADTRTTLASGSAAFRRWKETADHLARRSASGPTEDLLHNLALSLVDRNVAFEPAELFAFWDRIVETFTGGAL